jgi:hypothetical protein
MKSRAVPVDIQKLADSMLSYPLRVTVTPLARDPGAVAQSRVEAVTER